jgi:hypothetical protein
MRRLDFCALLGLSGFATLTGVTVGQASLRSWARRYRFTENSSGENQRLTGRIAPKQLSACFEELSQLSDVPLTAAGNSLRGRFSGVPFEVEVVS